MATAGRLCRTVLRRDVRELYGDAYDQAAKHAGKRIDARVAAFDLSFSDVKSVSLLAAGSTAEVRRQVQAARHAAIREVLAYLEREAAGVRRGHNGTERHKGLGFTAAAFDHRTSRAGDPQWHTHVLVQNATLGPDGRWSALDSKLLHAHAMAADRLYHAAVRAELTQRLEVRWRAVNPRSGAAEIDGLHDPALLRAFSTRRAQVLAQQAEWGHHGIRAGKAAALATRKWKERAMSRGTVPEGPSPRDHNSQQHLCMDEGSPVRAALEWHDRAGTAPLRGAVPQGRGHEFPARGGGVPGEGRGAVHQVRPVALGWPAAPNGTSRLVRRCWPSPPRTDRHVANPCRDGRIVTVALLEARYEPVVTMLDPLLRAVVRRAVTNRRSPIRDDGFAVLICHRRGTWSERRIAGPWTHEGSAL